MDDTTTLYTILDTRFGLEEARDVARYGCSGGVSDFIYSSELYDFFDDHEEDIENLLDEYDVTYQQLKPDFETMQQIREAAVWFAVEVFCQHKVERCEAEAA